MALNRLVSWFRVNSRRERRKANLKLEALECRLTPASTNDVFVGTMYRGLLGRGVDTNGLVFWSNQLSNGTSRTAVVAGIESSSEFISREVQLLYRSILGRTVDQGGLNFFGSLLQTGTSLEVVKADLYGSNEFFNHVGDTPTSFLNSVFQQELGRQPDAADLAFFGNSPLSAQGRTTAALAIMLSQEGIRERVVSDYHEILGRFPDTNGLNFWVSLANSGASDAAIVAGIAGSTEYFSRLQAFNNTFPSPIADTTAIQFLGANGLFTTGVPGTTSVPGTTGEPGTQQLAGNISTDPNLVVLSTTTTTTSPTALAALQSTIATNVSPAPFFFQSSTGTPAFTISTTTPPANTTSPAFAMSTNIFQDPLLSPAFTTESTINQQTLNISPFINDTTLPPGATLTPGATLPPTSMIVM
jgi:hypothetical protein